MTEHKTEHKHSPSELYNSDQILMGFARCVCGAKIDICPCLFEKANSAYQNDEILPDLDCETCHGSGFTVTNARLPRS